MRRKLSVSMQKKLVKKQPGVYLLQSVVTKKIYVGSSINLYQRKRAHFNALRNGRHTNPKLNRHCKKFGVNNIIFKVIEYCSKEELIKREQYYINKYKPYFNLSKKAINGMLDQTHTNETRKRMSLSMKNYYSNEKSRKHTADMMAIANSQPNGRLYKTAEDRAKVNRMLIRIKRIEQLLIDLSIELEQLKNHPLIIERNKIISDFWECQNN